MSHRRTFFLRELEDAALDQWFAHVGTINADPIQPATGLPVIEASTGLVADVRCLPRHRWPDGVKVYDIFVILDVRPGGHDWPDWMLRGENQPPVKLYGTPCRSIPMSGLLSGKGLP